jgi:hypothetical protein
LLLPVVAVVEVAEAVILPANLLHLMFPQAARQAVQVKHMAAATAEVQVVVVVAIRAVLAVLLEQATTAAMLVAQVLISCR